MANKMVTMRRPDRYRAGASLYDWISIEPVYRAGRVIGIDHLDLVPGDIVVDIGCGTGLNFALIRDRIGPKGLLLGIDASSHMLRQARRRTRAERWGNVRLMCADATTSTLPRSSRAQVGGPPQSWPPTRCP